MDLTVKIIRICGNCPVYEVGDKFIIKEGYKVQSEIPLCMHSLSSLMPYYNAFAKGVSPKELGLGKGKSIFIQCMDPHDLTDGGTVTMEICRNE
ncbi:TIGR04076 family protein [candidate division WOR-3 bacterium]|nr:TIGR04076 family protein [candidate division WOR-3 bacterium]